MRRWAINVTVVIFLTGTADAETFVSRQGGISFEIPAGMSSAGSEFLGKSARLIKKDGGTIYIRRVNGVHHTPDSAGHGKIEKTAQERFFRLPSGVSLGHFSDSVIGGRKVLSAPFDFARKKIKGTVFYIPSSGDAIEIICASEEDGHLEIFFECMSLIESIKLSNSHVRLQNKEDTNCVWSGGYFPATPEFEKNPDLIEMVIFENGLDFSGACGAIAWQRAALGISHLNPDEAGKWLLFAIESDRSYIPAYISLARLKLAAGAPAQDVVSEVNRLLDRAPQNEEILKLKSRLTLEEFK